MPILVRHNPQNLTREHYDKVNELMMAKAPEGAEGPPSAILLHVVFGDEGDLKVSEIWESEEAFRESFPILEGALKEAGVQFGEPQVLQVQEFWGSKVAE